MKKWKFMGLTMTLMLFAAFSVCTEKCEGGQDSVERRKGPETGLTITITYDNNPYDPRLRQAWGFSCVVRLREQVILFDTGGDGSILMRNMKELGIDPEAIDVVMLSHIHGDHIGGLASLLQHNNRVTVYTPISFPQRLKDEVKSSGARIREVDEAMELFEDVFTTGELNGGIKEQSLVVRTLRGLVVITGCAHPGVVNIVQKAKEIGKDRVYLVLGGFHLSGASISKIESIIENLVELGVERVAPCHCSGDQARSMFEKRFDPNYIKCGVGRRIIITW
jgi:7,8-dihydropterin-6-yl-methyl-4-(beta-D-ribofuranosyl)aminobenzene 5'-phosphate synthase